MQRIWSGQMLGLYGFRLRRDMSREAKPLQIPGEAHSDGAAGFRWHHAFSMAAGAKHSSMPLYGLDTGVA